MIVSLFLSLIFAHASPTSDAKTAKTCAWSLEHMDEADVRDAIERTELTHDRVYEEYGRLKTALYDLKVWAGRIENIPIVDDLYVDFNGALAQIVMGHDRLARELTDDLAAKLSIRLQARIDATLLWIELKSVAREFETLLTLAQFVVDGSPSPETLVQILVEQLKPSGTGYAGVGPRHIELIKLALQYGGTRGDAVLLQLGPGQVVTPHALAFFTGKPVIAVDEMELSPELAEYLFFNNVDFVTNLRDVAADGSNVRAHGPFRVILAQDALPTAGFPEPATGPSVLTTLRDLMEDTGMFILLTHGLEAPPFTRDEAEAAGFEVVRWAQPRPVAPEWLRLLPAAAEDAGEGDLFAYVLRKGDLADARARTDLWTIRNGDLERPGVSTGPDASWTKQTKH